jgi:ubiquinone/menaquinone biosynthesis C-methylase UbiE
VLDTAWRYEQRGKAHAYAERNPARTARELDLLAEVWPGRDDETVLDVPCGAGRLLDFLRQRGHRCIWADGALAMVQEARRRQQAPPAAVQAHALQLPLGDRSVDGVVQFRFLHHLPPAAAKTAVAEACRVARRFVVASFFHPCSSHHWQRRLRQLLAGRPPTRFAWTTTRLDGWFAKHGFRRVSKTADAAFRKDLWLCAYERVAQ